MDKEGFTGIRDLDAELLLKMDDREFIKTCNLNNYFIDLCKKDDYLIFKKKLQLFYPDTVTHEMLKIYKIESWKQYYSQVVKAVAKLKEKYNYDYSEGNPFIQFKMFESSQFGNMYKYDAILQDSISKSEFALVKYALQKKPDIQIHPSYLKGASILYDMKILKYLIDHGADINIIKGMYFSPHIRNIDYLKSLGLF